MQLPEPISHTVLAIYLAYEKNAWQGDSLGVPISQAANDCSRAVWYQLRWCSSPRQENEPGRKESIFATGRYWEERLLDDLEAIGCQVERLDPTTGQQFRVALASGWLRGKLDGQVLGLPEAPKTLHVVETKSHGSKSFKELTKKKLKEGKPDHYAQCQLYMHAQSLTRCLYYVVNKDTDERYTERVEYDHAFAVRLEAKVYRIVKQDSAPPRLFEDVTAKAAFPCQWCPSKPQCHEGAFARKNCRTCISSSFRDGAIVYCELHEKELSYKEQQAGCPSHLFLPSLVPGEQTDANEKDRWVKYKMKDGSEWVDGALVTPDALAPFLPSQ
jgi:hypothetical protein